MRKTTVIIGAVIAVVVLVTAVGIVLWRAGGDEPRRSTTTLTS